VVLQHRCTMFTLQNITAVYHRVVPSLCTAVYRLTLCNPQRVHRSEAHIAQLASAACQVAPALAPPLPLPHHACDSWKPMQNQPGWQPLSVQVYCLGIA
jgi:hypothetical protein